MADRRGDGSARGGQRLGLADHGGGAGRSQRAAAGPDRAAPVPLHHPGADRRWAARDRRDASGAFPHQPAGPAAVLLRACRLRSPADRSRPLPGAPGRGHRPGAAGLRDALGPGGQRRVAALAAAGRAAAGDGLLGEVVRTVLPGRVRHHDRAVGLVGTAHHRPAPLVPGRADRRRDPGVLRDGGHGGGDLRGLVERLVAGREGIPPQLGRHRAGRRHRHRRDRRSVGAVALPRAVVHLPCGAGDGASLRGASGRLAADAAAHQLLLPLVRVRRAGLRGGALRRPHPEPGQSADLVAGDPRCPRHRAPRAALARWTRLGGTVRDRRRLPALVRARRSHHLHLLRGGVHALADPVPDLCAGAGDRASGRR